MKTLSVITIALSLSLLGGCQSNLSWTPLDGASADSDKLEKARKACRIEIKFAGLERAEQQLDENLRQASTNQAKMSAREEFDEIRRQVYREIDTCMRRQGYKR